MLKQLLGAAALLLLAAMPLAAAPQADSSPRISAMYSTWDEYYFYAGFQVHDTNVIGTNTTPTSQPQQDDDIEVFFETDHAKTAVRTPQTFQMAVSAANGAYFSVGDNTKIPKAKAVYTYKYAATVDGTLNNSSDIDTGYTIEIAIPWQELGQNGPPSDGTVWGFNVISRDRSSTAVPGTRFYSLSPTVTNAADVQDPSKWSEIVFDAGGQTITKQSATHIVSPHVTGRFPTINGSIVSGEWPTLSRFTFGDKPIDAPAPKTVEEPNITDAAFAAAPVTPLPETPPAPPVKAPQTPVATTYPNAIPLPGGGSIKIVPGGIKAPAGLEPPGAASGPVVGSNPLTPKYPQGYTPPAPSVSLTGSLTLGPNKPASLVMALYRLDYNADSRKGTPQNVWSKQGRTLLVDQPINGAGPWFSGLRPLWHRQQLTDLRRSGIEVALLSVHGDDPLLPRELDALVEALKEMKARGVDYPLIGIDALTTPTELISSVIAAIPAEFRATLAKSLSEQAGMLCLAHNADQQPILTAALPNSVNALPQKVAIVSPGRLTGASLVPRRTGQTYADAWQAALETKPDCIVIDSWNDFTHGTEVCASRQYGEYFADQTKLQTIAFNGGKEWHAKYLAEYTPRAIRPKVLYQVALRIENGGTLPWRAGEGYSLCPRWYKDGRLFDDSAPRIPVGVDVLPGQSVTLNVGLVARNSYGDDLEPGDYMLVFDMVQGQDRWFSYADDIPLQVPVTVLAADAPDPGKPAATFLETFSPVSVQTGATYTAQAAARNDSGQTWPTNGYAMAYKIQTITGAAIKTVVESEGKPLADHAVQPGEVAEPVVPLSLNLPDGKPLPVGEYRLHWFIKPLGTSPAVVGSYDEPLQVIANDPGVSFVLSDIPRAMEAGKETTAKLAVQNLGAAAWAKLTMHIGYHWYYLDGMEAQWDGGFLSNLTKDVPVGGIDGAIVAKVRAPDRPGRYALVWDVQQPDGTWASITRASKGDDLLQVFVAVSGKGQIVPVDLTKYAELDGIANSDAPAGGDFDGQGHSLPSEMLPPDATAEVEGNPTLFTKIGPPLYPSGFYAAQTGDGWTSNHGVQFLYPTKRDGIKNIVICHGQTISLPGGSYQAIHLLAAATSGASVPAAFHTDQGQSQSFTIADWSNILKTDAASTPAFISPIRFGKNGTEPIPCILNDYALTLDPSHRVSSLTLPNIPSVKIVAISLEK